MEQLNELALFAGAGGGILGGKLLGWRTVCAVERDAYAAAVLAQRQNDGILEPFPIWSDVSTFHGEPWHGIVDVVSGGFPCQDISAAGKGEGITGKRSGLWKQMARIIREVGPRFVYVENSPILTSRGLDVVLSDLAALGFDAEWGLLSAADVGAPHKRERIWIVAHTECHRLQGREPAHRAASGVRRRSALASCEKILANSNEERWEWRAWVQRKGWGEQPSDGSWWQFEPALGRVANGVADRMDRLKAIGNGQVPLVAATAFIKLACQAK